MWSVLRSVLLLFALASCAVDSGANLRAHVNKGVSGYTGRVFPISPPVKIRFAPVKEFRFTKRSYVSSSGGVVGDSSSDYVGSIALYGDLLQWSFAGPPANPVLAVRYVIDKRGFLKGNVQVDAFGKVLSNEEKQFVERLKTSVRDGLTVFPEGKISTGDEVFSPEQYAEASAKIYPDITFQKNTYSGRAVGVSNEFNRPNLVVKYSGLVEAKGGALGQAAIEVTGHQVFDLGTGLPISRFLRFTISGIKDGVRFTSEQITSWKVTEVQY